MDYLPGFSFGIIGIAISGMLFASPIWTFRQVVKQKSTEKYEAMPYIATLLCTSLWVFYGLFSIDGFFIFIANIIGAFLHLIYVILFLIYAPKDIKVKTTISVVVLNIVVPGSIVAIIFLAPPRGGRFILGTLCMVATIGMYASPFFAVKTVRMTKSVEYMPFYLSLFQLLNGGAWFVYSFFVRDIFILVPSVLGLILGSAQLTVYVVSKNKSLPAKTVESIEGDINMHLAQARAQAQAQDKAQAKMDSQIQL